MKNYPLVAVIWNDPHIILRQNLPDKDFLNLLNPTLTVGLLYKKTSKYIILLHTVQRDPDQSDFTIIYTGCIEAIQEYGKIKLRKLRPKGAN